MTIKKVNVSTGQETEVPEDAPVLDPPLTEAQLDTLADQIADELMTQNVTAFRAMGETLAEVIFRVSNGQMPPSVTEQQARAWVRNTFRDKYRSLL